MVPPTAVRIALMLSKTCRVWTAISRATTSPVTGSTGTVPEMNRKSPARTACEYGPTGFTALSVKTTCLDLAIALPPATFPHLSDAGGVRQGDRSFSIVGVRDRGRVGGKWFESCEAPGAVRPCAP